MMLSELDPLTKVIINIFNNAINLSTTYAKHADRKCVTYTDVKMAMMVDYIAWDKLKDDRPKILEKEKEIAVLLDPYEEFTPSKCNCVVCTEINGIVNRLVDYEPSSNFSNTVKDCILDASSGNHNIAVSQRILLNE